MNKSFKITQPYPFDSTLKHHFLIGLLLGFWIWAFLYFVVPYDTGELSNSEMNYLLPGYGIAVMLSYLILLPFQQWLFKRSVSWSYIKEACILSGFVLVCWTFVFLYFKIFVVDWHPNSLHFFGFFKYRFLPTLTIILPFIMILRWLIGKFNPGPKTDQVVLKGSSKYDMLHLPFESLVMIQSANNYVEVTYYTEGEKRKELLRKKLSSVEEEIPELVRTHRSYLVNPKHFVRWSNENGKYFLSLSGEIQVPVSKTFKKTVEESLDFTTK